MNSTKILLGSLDYNEAKRIKSLLFDRGVLIEIASSPEACCSGKCKPSVEVFIQESDREAVIAFFEEEKAKSLAGLDYDTALMGEVFDPEKDTARCPACGAFFSTQMKECPDCGLMFGE